MAALIENGYPIFTDSNGDPVENGYIFIGVAGLNPISNPQTAYWDAELTIPAVNIRTSNGYPVYNGSPARLYVANDYSIVVQDKNQSTVYTLLNSLDYASTTTVQGIGFDNTEVVVKNATTVTVKAGSSVDVNGTSVTILSDTDLVVSLANVDYFIKVTALGVVSIQQDSGTFDATKNGRYDGADRILNWKARRDGTACYIAKIVDPVNLYSVDQPITREIGLEVATINTGQGDNKVYEMDQNVKITDAVGFATVNTGQGDNELYSMDQDVETTDEVVFLGVEASLIEATGRFDGPRICVKDTWTSVQTENTVYDEVVAVLGATTRRWMCNGYFGTLTVVNLFVSQGPNELIITLSNGTTKTLADGDGTAIGSNLGLFF